MVKKNLLLIIFTIYSINAFSFDFEAYLQKHQNDSNDVFLEQFPYSEYISVYQIDNISLLEKHRKQIYKIGKNGDDFLFNVFDQYIKQFKFNSDSLVQLSSLIEIGIIFINTDKSIIDSTNIYMDIGDNILQKSVYFIEAQINANNLDVSDNDVRYLINKLEKNGFLIKFDMSDTAKIILHIKNGDWNYLWKKFKSRCYDNRYLCSIFSLFVITILIILIRKLKNEKTNLK